MRTLTAASCLLAVLGCSTLSSTPPEISPRARAFNHYLMGDIHYRNGRFEEAIDEFVQAYKCAPDEPFLAKQIIRGYLMVHDLENARGYAENLVAEYPDDPGAWFILGRICRQQELYDEASNAFNKALSLTSFNVFIYDELLKAEEESNDLVSVVDIYLKLVQMHPDSAMLLERLGLSLARIGQNDEAKACLQKALELDSGLTDARNILGLIHLELDENESAAAQLRRYLASSPDDASAREHFAAALARLGRYDDALEEFNVLCEQENAEPLHHLARMFLWMRSGNPMEAGRVAPPNDAPIMGTLFRAIARKLSGEPYLPLLESLDEVDGDIDLESQAYLQDLLFLFGVNPTGDFLFENMDDIAKTGFQSQRFDILRARILMAQKRNRPAERILTETLGRFGPDKWVHYYLAILYEEMNDLANTEQHLEACLELDPNDPDVLNFLGYFYADHNLKLDRAEELVERALEISPENGFYLDSLGWVYYRQGRADLAVEYIRRSILRLETDDAVVRDHLGDAYFLQGEVEKALEEWERAHRLDPELLGVADKLQKYRQEEKQGGTN
ncbi:MAG TPA: tetratricopeptide repeat protein [Candidatus Hydrogenedentes bacterium]|nr:tetratricopeptide repeat protein [Candidatus Hydrogenedentota bacterium]HQH51461.1 tetratricopeptide repeat protein [Candidatus Hydrogenedentota bacterium]